MNPLTAPDRTLVDPLRPRRAEVGLLVLVTLVVVGAYLAASLGQGSRVPAGIGPFVAWVLGLGVVAHLAVRRWAPFASPVLVPLALLLTGLGHVVIARLGTDVPGGGDLAGLQATWTAIGIAGFVAVLVFVPRARVLERYRYLAGAGGVALLVAPLAPLVGRSINGSRIWVSLGPVNFQPGEFAKLALAVFFAGYLVDRRELLRTRLELRDLAPIAAAWIVSLGIMVLERDLGSSLLFFALFVVLLWVAAERAVFLVVGLVLFAAGAGFAVATFDHVERRVDAWLDPWDDPKGTGFQIIEAQFALADGGLIGTGLGEGEPDRIPFVESDFVFAAIGEELGLAGAAAVLMIDLSIVAAGLGIAVRSVRTFETLLAVGLTTLFGLQAFIICAGIVRLVPLTGITLPFVSYGGSSLVANYVLVALLVRLSHEARDRELAAACREEIR